MLSERRATGATAALVVGNQRAFVEVLGIGLTAHGRVDVVVTDQDGALDALADRPGDPPVDVAVLMLDGDDDDEVLSTGSRLQLRYPGVALVAVADSGDPVLVARAVRAGVRGWISKEASVAELEDVLGGVARGETRIPALLLTGVLPLLIHEQDERREAEELLGPLTSRERQVLRALCQGSPQEDIAADLSISLNTLRTHVQRVRAKLGVHTALAAVTIARRAGL